MAFGFTPNYTENLSLDNLTQQQFLVLSIDIAKMIGWQINYISNSGVIAYTNNGMFKFNAKITIKLDEDWARIKSESTGREIFDLGKNKKVVTKFTSIFYDLKYSIDADELKRKYEELKPSLTSDEEDILTQPTPTSKEKFANFFSFFTPRENYFVTPILVNLNIIVFILMVLSGVNFFLPDNQSLINWGANFRPVTLEGQWWRLLTNCFIHIGVFHLLMNMYALIYIGLLLEPYLGKTRFTAAYVLTGIVASLTSLYWHELTISAGASGAIFGMYGVFLAMLTTNFIEKTSRKALLTSISIFVGYNLLNGVKGGIDNSAHIGGLISGLIIGYSFYPSLKKAESINLKYSITGMLTILVLTTSFVVYNKIPNEIGKYDAKMKMFSTMEQTALAVYRLPKTAPKEKLLSAIQDSGINNWNKCLVLLNEVEKLKLPTELNDTRTPILIEYCNLRIKSYRLIYKTINEDTIAYADSIKYYNAEIEKILNSLKVE